MGQTTFIYLFGVLRRFQHCTGHITTGSWKGRGNQYIQFVRVLYCKLPTNGKQLPAFPLEAVPGIEPANKTTDYATLVITHSKVVFKTGGGQLKLKVWALASTPKKAKIIEGQAPCASLCDGLIWVQTHGHKRREPSGSTTPSLKPLAEFAFVVF